MVVGQTLELAGLTKEGLEFPLELSLSSWANREGIFFTGIMRDVTTQRTTARLAAAKYRAAQVLARVRLGRKALPAVLREVCDGLGFGRSASCGWRIAQAHVLEAGGVVGTIAGVNDRFESSAEIAPSLRARARRAPCGRAVLRNGWRTARPTRASFATT